ncbi:tail protein X [Alteromonas sp. a30]|uniref:tail protein X n=1 Tax=Alteromonas sp. a30 TaxID=2730917 RepID=UPI002281FDA8|nr:tail protein X [Alteromonas sp. a30]MCY7295089.1 phage tail protein [Alteromonas sp. a30]
MLYRTRQGDVLDEICFNHYQREDLTEFVLHSNRGLAGQGAVLPSGLLIELPEAPNPEPQLNSLFD